MVGPHFPKMIGAAGSEAMSKTFISAALDHGPRFPASVRAMIRRYRADTGVKDVVFRESSSR